MKTGKLLHYLKSPHLSPGDKVTRVTRCEFAILFKVNKDVPLSAIGQEDK